MVESTAMINFWRARGGIMMMCLAAAVLAGCAASQAPSDGSDGSDGGSRTATGDGGDGGDGGDANGSTAPEGSEGADASSEPDDPSGADEPSTGAVEPPEACDLQFDGAASSLDCAAIARLVPTGVGISEAHVARRHYRLEDASGAALGAEYHACLLVTDGACEAVPVALEAAPSRAITALLVRPHADPTANAELAAALAKFIDLRPEGELIGVYRWGAEVTQISTPTADRGRLHRLLASGLQPLDADSAALADAVEAVAEPLVSIRRDSHLSLRQLVVVAPGHAALAPGALERHGATAHLRVELVAAPEVDAALPGASARLDAALAAGELLVRQCGLDRLSGLQLHTAGGGPTFALSDLAIVDKAAAGSACDADQGLTPVLPEVLEISFSPAELVNYKARLKDLSKEPFFGSLRTDLNAPGVAARVKLKLRGKSSLDCQRKSLALSLTDDRARQWLPDSGIDKFMLISMCNDDRYITQYTANLLMAQRGLFAPKFRMVELVIDGASQGAYLLVEKPQTVLARDSVRTRVIVRRRTDIQGAAPELKYADDDEAQALAAYEALVGQAEVLGGNKLLAWLEQAMDLDQYLGWIALMSALESGDFIDEVYFVSSEVTGPDASPADYFSVSAWDQDDIFSSCHKDGINAIVDPHGLLNCVEGRLDHAIFDAPAIYKRYAKALAQTVAWLDQATFDAAVHASEDRVLEILVRDEARAAMVELLADEPGAIAYEVAEEQVLARGAELRKRFAKRRDLLIQRLADYGP